MSSRIDNDETKGLAIPFVVLAHVRAGGTFCCHALSNHPMVYCDREETVHHLSSWRKVGGMKPGRILWTIWGMAGYQAAGARLIYTQAFDQRVWPVVEEAKPRIIHLRRRAVLRQALSQAYQQGVRSKMLPYHPVHSFEEKQAPVVTMKPAWALCWVRRVTRQNKIGLERMAAYPGEVLEIFYEDMTGDQAAVRMEPAVAHQIEDFLSVRRMVLPVDLKRDFQRPIETWFTNWDEIRAELDAAGFGGLDG